MTHFHSDWYPNHGLPMVTNFRFCCCYKIYSVTSNMQAPLLPPPPPPYLPLPPRQSNSFFFHWQGLTDWLRSRGKFRKVIAAISTPWSGGPLTPLLFPNLLSPTGRNSGRIIKRDQQCCEQPDKLEINFFVIINKEGQCVYNKKASLKYTLYLLLNIIMLRAENMLGFNKSSINFNDNILKSGTKQPNFFVSSRIYKWNGRKPLHGVGCLVWLCL